MGLCDRYSIMWPPRLRNGVRCAADRNDRRFVAGARPFARGVESLITLFKQNRPSIDEKRSFVPASATGPLFACCGF
jgi:hypothetical protein